MADKLEFFSGYTSIFISTLVREYFKNNPVDKIWQALEMEKPMKTKDRIKKLEIFIEKTFDDQKNKNNKEEIILKDTKIEEEIRTEDMVEDRVTESSKTESPKKDPWQKFV